MPKPKTRCAAKRRLRFKIHGKTVVRVDVFVNGKHVKRVRSRHGRYVKHVSIRRPRKKRFRVKIVAHFADGRRTITVRKYRRCKKTHPHTHVVKPH